MPPSCLAVTSSDLISKLNAEARGSFFEKYRAKSLGLVKNDHGYVCASGKQVQPEQEKRQTSQSGCFRYV